MRERQGYQTQPSEAEAALLAQIATDILGIATLNERRSDSLDFHEVSCWDVRKALQQAYRLGKALG